MRVLYGRAYDERYRVVADLVQDGSHVVDLCCGCGYLYTAFLAQRGIAYTGVDLLPAMTRAARARRRARPRHASHRRHLPDAWLAISFSSARGRCPVSNGGERAAGAPARASEESVAVGFEDREAPGWRVDLRERHAVFLPSGTLRVWTPYWRRPAFAFTAIVPCWAKRIASLSSAVRRPATARRKI